MSQTAECCAICLEEFSYREYWLTWKTACNHRFHRTCLEIWLNLHATHVAPCPLCRKEIRKQQVHPPRFTKEVFRRYLRAYFTIFVVIIFLVGWLIWTASLGTVGRKESYLYQTSKKWITWIVEEPFRKIFLIWSRAFKLISKLAGLIQDIEE